MKRKTSRYAEMMASALEGARIRYIRELEAMVADRGRERDAAQEAAGSAERRSRELDAQCAAMREALEIVVSAEEYQNGEISDFGFETIRSALSGDAGRAMLERVEALELVADAARRCRDSDDEDRVSEFDAMSAALDALEPKR